MKKTIIVCLAFLSLALFISSCTKEGDIGPAGKDGNANVSSKYYTVSSWSVPAAGSIYTDIANSDITQSVIDSGSVMVYLNVNNAWTPLPYNRYYSNHFIATTFQCTAGNVRIIVTESDLTNPPQDILSLKVVTIGGH